MFNLRETVYFAHGDTIRSGVVSQRTTIDNLDGSETTYEVVNPDNTSEIFHLKDSEIFSTKEAVKEVLFQKETKRHEEAVSKIQEL